MSSARTIISGILILFIAAVPGFADDDHDRPSGNPRYGWVVDSVTVSGNTKTQDLVVLREMETQPGSVVAEQIIERDIRFLRGLGLFADVEIAVDSLAPGRCALRVSVKERSSYFLKTILPIINYDFDKGFSYGIKWNNRNFRGMRESLVASYLRDTSDDNNFSFSWFAPWLGWEHVEFGANAWYFDRSEIPINFNVLKQLGSSVRLGVPLTKKRISFAQFLARLAIENRQAGNSKGEFVEQKYLSPLAGILLDSRDSRLRPMRGHYFYLAVASWRAVDGPSQIYYRLWNDTRFYHQISERNVLAMRSNLNYQFGEYPEYLLVGLGGSGTLRGYAPSEFIGEHRWFQTVEWRHTLLPRRVFRLPYLDYFDVTIGAVLFIDSGITWRSADSFTADNFHGGAGLGLRLYSPYQDVVRFDIGFNAQGEIFPSLRTGIRF